VLRVAAAGSGTCLALASFALAGWLAGIPAFTTLGVGTLASQPTTTLCFLSISASLLVRLLGFGTAARILLGIGAAFTLLAPMQWLLGYPLGFERWLASGPLRASAGLHMQPTRPATLLQLFLLLCAMLPGTATGRPGAKIGLALATAALLYATFLLLLHVSGIPPSAADNPLFMISVPGTAMSLTLAIAVVAWRYRDGWPLQIAVGAAENVAGSLGLSGLLAAVVMLQLLINALTSAAQLDPRAGDAVALLVDLMLIAVLVGHASYRLAQSRVERDELAGAVEHAAVIVVDRDSRIRYWSKGAEELFGWTAAEAVGQLRKELLQTELLRGPPVDDDERRPDWHGELVERHRDGHLVHIDNRAKLLQHSGGEHSGVNILTDISARRLAEGERLRNEARLRAVIDLHRLVVMEWSIATGAIDWAINTELLFGDTAVDDETALRHHIGQVVDPAVVEAIRRDAASAIASGSDRFVRTIRMTRPDGRDAIVETAGLILRNGDGMPVSLIAANNDVTDHYRREEAIRLSEARLAAAVAVQGIFVYEYDIAARQTVWTTPGEIFFGIDDSASDPNWLLERFPELANRIRTALDAAVARHDDRLQFAFEFWRADGTRRQAESWARIVYDDGGNAVRAVGTHLDVTERTRRETALRASVAEMRAVLATVPDAMIVCGADGIIRSCSTTAETLFGCEKGGLIGSHILDLTNEDGVSRTALRRRLSQLFIGKSPTALSETIIVHSRHGEAVPVSFIVGGATVEGQRMFVVFARDMRADIDAEENFHKLQADLAQVSRIGMMGEMAGALAHELSQPLAAIVNFLGAVELMIEAGAAPDRIGSAIHRAGEQASRAGEIVRRLRAFIERGEADMRAEPITDVIREAAALALFNMSSLNVRLNYDFESETRMILGDRVQIQQVLVNLIRNGVDAMTSDGCLRREMIISTSMGQDNDLIVAVKDSGPGIGPEILDRLFKPFTTTKSEGLGFGLSISRRIVEAHGGTLTAHTGEDGGAIFRFNLPLMDMPVDAMAGHA
jgi:two-component system sensor kinase FixL